jgi:hypothetical protein
VPSVALVDAVLLIVGASLVPIEVIVAVCCAHRPAPSQTCSASTHDAGGTGPSSLNAMAPVPLLMVPPHVCVPRCDQVRLVPSGSLATGL